MLSNLIDGNDEYFEEKDKVPYEKLSLVDKYIVQRLHEMTNNFIDAFDKFSFNGAMNGLFKFVSDDLSSFYLDITKDSLYCDGKDSLRRKQIQTVFAECVSTLMRLLNPILPFTMDEVNQNFSLKTKENVQLYRYPEKDNNLDTKLIQLFQKNVVALRNDVLKAIEEKRNENVIHSSQEASLEIELINDELKKFMDGFDSNNLKEYFIVSDVKFVDSLNEGYSGDVSKVEVKHHSGIKCDRCWNYFDEDEIEEIEGVHVCKRCHQVLKK